MADNRVDKLADMMVNYSVAVKPGNKVAITGDSFAEPLVKAVYREVLKAGGFPLTLVNINGLEDIFYKHANDEQLKHVSPPYKMMMSDYDVRISCLAKHNTKALSGVDPQRMVTRSRAFGELMKIFMRRSADKSLRWTLTIFPTNACAQDAEMSLDEYEDFVYAACMPDLDDPIGYWKKLSDRQEKIITWLKDKEEVHIKADGTDLRLSIKGRTFINCDAHSNVPGGEIFTGPVENSAEGQVYFTYPAIYDGREVTGIRLWFERGKVVKATADKNEVFLNKVLDTDTGARYLGEFAFGTNEGITKFTRQILFDEKIGGSFHLAVGAGYPETGSNNESAVHWDMVCDLRRGGHVEVDGVTIYENGKFIIDF